MAVTLASLARQAGVDPSLVSRVLRGDPKARISDEKRALIIELAESTGYRPNRLGKSLRTQRTFILGMLTPDITNPFHSWLFRAVEETAQAAGYDVLLCNTDDDIRRFGKVVRTLSEGHVDGLLVATARARDPAINLLRELELPYVLLNRRREDAEEAWFGPDAFQVGWLGADHLVSLGHRRIALMLGDLEIGNMVGRLNGFRAAFAEQGISEDRDLMRTGIKGRMQAREEVRSLLRLPVHRRPTALCIPDTIISSAAVTEIHAGGLSIPRDISVVGYSATAEPDITSICVPVDRIGHLATECLIDHLNTGNRGPVVAGDGTLPASLVEAGSTAAPATS